MLVYQRIYLCVYTYIIIPKSIEYEMFKTYTHFSGDYVDMSMSYLLQDDYEYIYIYNIV